MRDDFTQAVKDSLAKRAGYRCSFTGCRRATVGPSNEGEQSSSNVGMACHIAAASAGRNARRYDATMTAEERRLISNGIWLCYLHGKLIDTDEARFTVSQLKKMKEVAEIRAQRELESPNQDTSGYFKLDLGKSETCMMRIDDVSVLIGDAITDSSMADILGNEIMLAARDVCIEVALNSFRHGGATKLTFEVSDSSLSITDNGTEYSLLNLYRHRDNSGGGHSVTHLIESFSDKLIITSEATHVGNRHEISFFNSLDDVRELTHCYLEISAQEAMRGASSELDNLDPKCQIIYLLLPDYMVKSQSVLLSEVDKGPSSTQRLYIFLSRTRISTLVKICIQQKFPSSIICDGA